MTIMNGLHWVHEKHKIKPNEVAMHLRVVRHDPRGHAGYDNEHEMGITNRG